MSANEAAGERSPGTLKRIVPLDACLDRAGEDLAVGEVLLPVARDPRPAFDPDREIRPLGDRHASRSSCRATRRGGRASLRAAARRRPDRPRRGIRRGRRSPRSRRATSRHPARMSSSGKQVTTQSELARRRALQVRSRSLLASARDRSLGGPGRSRSGRACSNSASIAIRTFASLESPRSRG